MSGSVEHLAMFFHQVNADDAGQYTIAGLHDLDQGWISEVKSLKSLLREVTCPLLLFIHSSHFRWSRREPNFCLVCYLISELNHDLFSQSTWFWILAFNAIYLCPIEHIDINAVWNRWTGKHFVELFSKEEKQRQLKKLLVRTAKWVIWFTNFIDQTVLSIFQNFYKSFDRLIPRSPSS